MSHLSVSPEMDNCISNCIQCHLICLNMATGHCIEKGGAHIDPDHLRTMFACAEICRASAYIMTTGSSLHHQMCALCADACEACVNSCKDLDGMDECVRACRRCKESCEAMTLD